MSEGRDRSGSVGGGPTPDVDVVANAPGAGPSTSPEVGRRLVAGVGWHDRAAYDTLDADGTPCLNASTLSALVNASPRHAWYQHPTLNPDWRREERRQFDIGTAAHASLIGGDHRRVVLIHAPDYRTKVAQELRNEAYAAGAVPLLEGDADAVNELTDAVRAQLDGFDASPPLLTDGHPEQTLSWHEPDGTACKARLDWLRDDFRAVDDLKTTTGSADPERWTRRIFELGHDIQAAWYLRGVYRIAGVDAAYRLIVAETAPPYAVSVIAMGPAVLELANRKIAAGLRLWNECLARGRELEHWRGYPAKVCYAQLPAWEEARWLDREARGE